ncbi:MAG: hypothetical protein RMI93_00110, partial [Caldimicrobium sp.]|nr:hypothetical protein [Caldimicrobium sp.]MDW8181996.1 hypothetical protein [Caldimicrobium sp.]
GYGERFNRTLEEEFVVYREFMRYLICCDTERVHNGLGNVSPLEWICYKFNENFPWSKILWTHTNS